MMMKKADIEKLLPHREPFLLLDEVLNIDEDTQKITCAKRVESGSWFFNGHFPGHPVMPGVLIIESLAQSAALYAMHSMPKEMHGRPVFFTSIESAKFKKPVYPDSDLILEAELLKKSSILWKFSCIAKVGSVVCTQCTITATIAKE